MSLSIITGPMFSGKTSALINIIEKEKKSNKVAVINYIDDNYDEKKMATHDGKSIECIRTKKLSDVIVELSRHYNIFAINEAQFFEDIYEGVIYLLDNKKIVHICGLDGDYKKEPFGDMLRLIPHCDKIIKLKAICDCGSNAIFTKRLNDDEEQIIIGDKIYKPVCRKCY